MEVLRETPVKLTLQEQWAETPSVVGIVVDNSKRKPLRVMQSNKKRPAPSSTVGSTTPVSALKKSRIEVGAPVKSHDIDDRIRLLFPDDDVIGKVRRKEGRKELIERTHYSGVAESHFLNSGFALPNHVTKPNSRCCPSSLLHPADSPACQLVSSLLTH